MRMMYYSVNDTGILEKMLVIFIYVSVNVIQPMAAMSWSIEYLPTYLSTDNPVVFSQKYTAVLYFVESIFVV